jgi:ubiquinone/menaquinone biosynthesis C-methylase UbiE
MDWNALASAWVADEAMLEHLHGPLCRTLVAAVDPRAGDRVVDIGFGTGATLAAFANAVGGEGHVLGLDIAEGMVARAAERMAEHGHVEVLCGDAASHDFDEGRADLVVSLFGLMFFDEPETAFANIARALRPGGRMVFVASTPRGEIRTPAFMPVGTAATVKAMLPESVRRPVRISFWATPIT